MKKGRLFAAIIYFIFTFAIGLIIAFTLPGYFASFTVPAEYVDELLSDGDFVTAMVLLGDCYNKSSVYERSFESGGGIVLFETVMQYESNSDAQAEQSDLLDGMLYRTYMGFMYGIGGSYSTYATSNNLTRLVVTSADGSNVTVELLDFDANDDGTLDGISTATQKGFVVLDIKQVEVGSIQTLTFYDSNGDVFGQPLTLTEALSYTSDFFAHFEQIEEYNGLVEQYSTATSEERTAIEGRLSALFNGMTGPLAQDNSYVVISARSVDYINVTTQIKKRADIKALPFTIGYFVAIYVIADFLLGSHLIIKFFRWFLFKVCKIKPKNKQKRSSGDVFGSDYYSSVTMSLDVTGVPDFNESVQVKYANSDVEVVFILLKENNYTATERIKAGTYVNPFIDMNRDYAPTDLPDNLVVEGYKMDIKIKIIRREV